MTKIIDITAPKDERGNDPNDFRGDPHYREKLDQAEAQTRQPNMDWINRFTLSAQEIEELSDPEWLYENLIIRSHLIAIPARPNAGKTTICMYVAGVLAERCNVVYVNADVGGGDIKALQALADDKGFRLMLPDMKDGLSMDDVVDKVGAMNEISADYSEYIFFFDTLKKMTDVINKASAKKLYKTLRGLTAKGMTIVLLAHTNKYSDADGKPIYEGTGDLRSDVDDLIYLIPRENEDGSLTVSTDPLADTAKRRGNHQPITFHISPDRQVSPASYVDTAAMAQAQQDREKDAPVIEAITEAIQAGHSKQIAITNYCRDEHGIGWRTVTNTLNHYLRGPIVLWYRDKGFEKNTWLYRLTE